MSVSGLDLRSYKWHDMGGAQRWDMDLLGLL
jgi:hypothetical protein